MRTSIAGEQHGGWGMADGGWGAKRETWRLKSPRRGVLRRGFTMVEIIVVVVIIAVLSGMVILSFAGSIASTSLRTSAMELLRASQYAHNYAVTRRARCRLVIDAGNNQFRLEAETDPINAPGQFHVVTADLMRPHTLPRGVRFGAVVIDPQDGGPQRAGPSSAPAGLEDEPARGARQIVFFPTGQADAAAIIVTDGNQSLTVRIASTTARAQVDDGQVPELLSDRMDLDA